MTPPQSDSPKPPRKPNDIDKHVGRQVSAARSMRRKEISELAAAAGMSPEDLAACESGDRVFSKDEAQAVAAALSIRPQMLMDGLPMSPPEVGADDEA